VSEAAGAIELISSNGGFSGLRGRTNGQVILAESLYVEGNSGGYSQVSVDVPSTGTAAEAPSQNITLTGVVDPTHIIGGDSDVGLLVRSIDDGAAQVTSRNRSSELIGQDGVNQNSVQIGLEQNITVLNGGIRIISEDSNATFDGANDNAFAQLQGGNQTLEAEYFEVIANDGDVYLNNRNNLDGSGNDANKVQTIIANGANSDGEAILVRTNVASNAEFSSFISNYPSEPPGGGSATPNGSIGAQQTITALGGSIIVRNDGSGSDSIYAEIYGGGQEIDTQFIEILANGGTAGIGNESNLDNPKLQDIHTTGDNGGVGILVQSSDDWTAYISSFDRVLQVADPNIGTAYGMPQTIVADDSTIRVITMTDVGETGEAYIYGGQQSITGESIEVISNNSDASIWNDVVTNDTANGQTITAQCDNPDCTGVLVRSDGAGSSEISSFFATEAGFTRAEQDINVLNSINGGSLTVQTSASGNAVVDGAPQNINAEIVNIINGGTGSAVITTDPPPPPPPPPTTEPPSTGSTGTTATTTTTTTTSTPPTTTSATTEGTAILVSTSNTLTTNAVVTASLTTETAIAAAFTGDGGFGGGSDGAAGDTVESNENSGGDGNEGDDGNKGTNSLNETDGESGELPIGMCS
jgi:hypothetical protein